MEKKKAAKLGGQKSPVSKVWLCKSSLPAFGRILWRGWRGDGCGDFWFKGMCYADYGLIHRHAPLRRVRWTAVRGAEVDFWVL